MRRTSKKTPLIFRISLCLVAALLISTYLMSGLYARYSTQATGSSSAQVAQIDFEILDGSHVTQYGGFDNFEFNGNSGDVYMVMETFAVINSGDVTYDYTLNLRLSVNEEFPIATPDSFITLDAPKTLNQVKYIKGNGTIDDHASAASTVGTTKFNQGKAYYAVSTNGTDYTWYETTPLTDGFNTLSCAEMRLGYGQVHYYKIVYFIEMNAAMALKQMNLSCAANCIQVD